MWVWWVWSGRVLIRLLGRGCEREGIEVEGTKVEARFKPAFGSLIRGKRGARLTLGKESSTLDTTVR